MEKSFTTAIKLYIIGKSSGCGSVWLERTAGGREVAGSNPVTPTDLLRRRAEVRACPRFWRTLAISERAFWHFRGMAAVLAVSLTTGGALPFMAQTVHAEDTAAEQGQTPEKKSVSKSVF